MLSYNSSELVLTMVYEYVMIGFKRHSSQFCFMCVQVGNIAAGYSLYRTSIIDFEILMTQVHLKVNHAYDEISNKYVETRLINRHWTDI